MKTMMFMVMLTACYTDPKLKPALDELKRQDAAFFEEHPQFFHLVIGDEEEMVADGAFGRWDPALKVIEMVDPEKTYVKPNGASFYLGSKHAVSVLAHELGHAMGLEHNENGTGLMEAVANSRCWGKEMACLRQELTEFRTRQKRK